MERYLLFDSGCMRCTELARQIEHATQGWLKARSLHDPAMQTLLNTARPGWRWEPALVEIAGERVQVFTGLRMRAHLAVKLGPRRALRVIQFVQHALLPQGNIGQERRSFLKRGAMLAGLLIVGPKSGDRATAASSGIIVRSEEKVNSLEEAIRISPAKLLIPSSHDFILKEVGVFRNAGGSVTDVLLHYEKGANELIFVDFRPRADKAATLRNATELRWIRDRPVQFSADTLNPTWLMASWVDVNWTIAVVGFGATIDDLISIIASM